MVSKTVRKFDRQQEEWRKAYDQLSRITGFSVENLYDRCLVLVNNDKTHRGEYYGTVGILSGVIRELKCTRYRVDYLGERKRETVEFECAPSLGGEDGEFSEVSLYNNAPLLLEHRANMGVLFDKQSAVND